MGPIYKRMSSPWTKEESIFCHAAHPMEYHSPGTQIGPNNLSLDRKALKSIAVLGCLATGEGFYNGLLSLCKDGSAIDHQKLFLF